ncbi:MAG: hypothetical protein JRI68_10650 [Deltaproteobacteria bacterium]|nr:hypothetical protein [Deltaproteobacteria bacterium]
MLEWLKQSWKVIVPLLLCAAFGWWWFADGPIHVGADPGPNTRMVILLHGHGAPKSDLKPLAEELAQGAPNLGFVIPGAPHSVGVNGRTWYPRFTAESKQAVQQRMAEFRAEARAIVVEIARDLMADGVPAQQIYVGGFSAGAVLGIDTILSPEGSQLGGLIALSGGKMKLDFGPLAERAPLRAFVSHGTRDRLVGAVEFDGRHEIPMQVRADLRAFLHDGA